MELKARIQAVIRRSYGRTKNEINIGRLRIDPNMRKAYVDGLEISLSAKEFDILEYIASRHPDVVSSEDIVEHIYDEFFDPFSSVLRVHIANLRKKLNVVSGEGLVITVKGKGYPLNTINGFVAKDQIENMYLSAMLKDLPFLLILIVFIFVTGAIILSKILQRQQEKQALLLARQLSRIDDNNDIIPGHPAIAKAYSEIKNRLAANALDYVRLSSYVTHEQKNMLSLLRAKLQLSGNSELMDDVDKVVDSLDDILTLSASVNSSEMEIIDAALVCADVCDEYKKIYPDIFFDFDDTANYQIAAKELWINRAVSNLVNNAVKYGKGRIEVSVSNQKGSIIISVSDEGNGLGDEELEKLFDYRYRVGQLKKDGYGIGLSLVRHVCDLCGGLCWAENGKMNGMVFYMVFPEALTVD